VNIQNRYAFLDVYRGLFVLLMIEGHLTRVVLEPAARQSSAFELHEAISGITAPGFLFTSGFALTIATLRRWEELTALTPGLARRVWRGLLFIAIGYALQLPYFSLSKTLAHASADEWTRLLSFGILQLVGSTLIAFRLLLLAARSERLFLPTLGLVFLGIVFGAPLVWSSDLAQSLPRGLSMALTGKEGSPFPLFPYAAFLFSGSLVSWRFLRNVEKGSQDRFMRGVMILGILFVTGGNISDVLPFSLYGPHDYWNTSPAYFFIRLGMVLILMAGVFFLDQSIRRSERLPGWPPRWLQTLGMESFFAYILHLLLIFGWITNPFFNIEAFWSHSLPVTLTIGMYCALAAVITLATAAWHIIKHDHTLVHRGLLWWFGLSFLYYFLTNPY